MIEDIRTKVGERCQFENQMVSSTDALYRHWKRSCWVNNVWRQADHTEITLQPLVQYGWIVKNDTLTFDWESEKNVSAVQERVHRLLKGCKCKTGCGSKRCGCKGKDRKCCIGCECVNCTNTDADCSSSSTLTTTSGDTNLLDVTLDEYLNEVSTTNTDSTIIPEDVDDLMDWVFGVEDVNDHSVPGQEEDNDN